MLDDGYFPHGDGSPWFRAAMGRIADYYFLQKRCVGPHLGMTTGAIPWQNIPSEIKDMRTPLMRMHTNKLVCFFRFFIFPSVHSFVFAEKMGTYQSPTEWMSKYE